MTQYLLSVWAPEGAAPLSEAEMARAYADVDHLNTALKAAGAWVFAGGLHPADTASVARLGPSGEVVGEGPYLPGGGGLGGFWIIQTADRGTALEWARQATRACRIPVEVRAFQEE